MKARLQAATIRRRNKGIAASNTISKAFETGDASALDGVVADDFVNHTDIGDKTGKDSLKANGQRGSF